MEIKNILILIILISPIFLFSGNSKATSHETEVNVYGFLTRDTNLIGKTNSVPGCNNNSTAVTFFCISEGSNHDSDTSYVTTDFKYLLRGSNSTWYVFDGVYEYINNSDITIDLISWSFIARVTSGSNDTISIILAPLFIGPNSNDCLNGPGYVSSFTYGPPPDYNFTNLLTTEYQIFSGPFTNECDAYNPGHPFTQENLRDLAINLAIYCSWSICVNYTYEARITSVYMTVIWHDNNPIILSPILTATDLVLIIILLIAWIVFFILGLYVPSGILCIVGSFCAIVLMLLYILPYNLIATSVVAGLAICCFFIGISLAVQGDA